MLKSGNNDKDDKLSIRTSIIVWLSGAVLGWVVAVLAVYAILRAPDRSFTSAGAEKAPVEQAAHTPSDGGNPANLSAIEPAAGSPAAGHSKNGSGKGKP